MDLLETLDAEFSFGVDAAASPGSEAFPGRPFIPPGASERGSLGVPWSSFAAPPSAVFLNPPYSRQGGPDERGVGRGIWSWHRKALLESQAGFDVVLLAPPHFGRRWYRDFGQQASEIRVFSGRLAFRGPDGEPVRGNSQDSCLTIYRHGESGPPAHTLVDVLGRPLASPHSRHESVRFVTAMGDQRCLLTGAPRG